MAFPYRHLGAFRLLLASLVVFQHFTANAAPGPFRDAMQLYWGGDIAVLIFFCLSGFVIGEAVDCVYFKRPLSFIVNRMLRIVPHFVIAVLLSVILQYAFFSADTLRVAREVTITPEFASVFSFQDIVWNCLGFLPIPLRSLSQYDFLDAAWAIRIEMAFYLAVFLSLASASLLAWQRSRGLVFMAAAAVLLYMASAVGLLPPKVGLVAYFAFGYGLYAVTTGSRPAFWFTCACIPAIILHFAKHPNYTVVEGVGRNLVTDFLLLGLLMTAMVFLACNKISRFRRADRFLGDLTYPLYMYHLNVLIIVMSTTAGYHYSVYIAGMVLSILVAYAMSATLDPLINRFRNRIRGRRVDIPLTVPAESNTAAEQLSQAG
jgi:peptidoglycan/LPS O-acetylase OafA/YrhL